MILKFGEPSRYNPMVDAELPLDTSWHVYRLEVIDTSLKLYVDGSEVLRTTDNRDLEPGTVGIFCDGQISVGSFRVVAL